MVTVSPHRALGIHIHVQVLFLVSWVRDCSCLSFSYAYLLSEGEGLR